MAENDPPRRSAGPGQPFVRSDDVSCSVSFWLFIKKVVWDDLMFQNGTDHTPFSLVFVSCFAIYITISPAITERVLLLHSRLFLPSKHDRNGSLHISDISLSEQQCAM